MERGSRSSYLPLRDAIDQLFAGSFITPSALGGSFPPADMYLTDNDVILELAVPGANPNNLDISVHGDTVTVSGEVRHQHPGQQTQQGTQGRQAVLQEIWQGKFQRTFTLPVEVNSQQASASYDNGILTLTMPKSEAMRPHKIHVKTQHTIQGQSSSS